MESYAEEVYVLGMQIKILKFSYKYISLFLNVETSLSGK